MIENCWSEAFDKQNQLSCYDEINYGKKSKNIENGKNAISSQVFVNKIVSLEFSTGIPAMCIAHSSFIECDYKN